MAKPETMKVGIRADKVNSWSIEVFDLETGKPLPIVEGSIQIDTGSFLDGIITATATMQISFVDIKEASMRPEYNDQV